MKRFILIYTFVIGIVLNINGACLFSNHTNKPYNSLYKSSSNASLTIRNRSSYTLTVKIMKTNGRGLYQIVTISPQSSNTIYFSKSDTFYTKTKASKGLETLYKKTGTFSIQCDDTGYSQATLEFYVSSGSGGTGQSISKAEFESNK